MKRWVATECTNIYLYARDSEQISCEKENKLNNSYYSHIPLRHGVLLSVDLWDITQNRLLTSTDS